MERKPAKDRSDDPQRRMALRANELHQPTASIRRAPFRSQQLVRRDGQLADAVSDCVKNGIRDGRRGSATRSTQARAPCCSPPAKLEPKVHGLPYRYDA